jgi:hypothetical protein
MSEGTAVLPLAIVICLCLAFPPLVWADPAKDKVTICHKPGTPAEKTMEVPANAVSGHLAHGDRLGSCSDLSGEGAPAQPGEAEEKVTICHKPGTPAEKTMEVPADAVGGHLAHGDQLGPCEESGVSAGKKVLLCHKPGTPAQKTMQVPPSALEAHLDHGDVLGSCLDLWGGIASRRPVIAPSGVSMATWRVCGCRRPYAY